MTKKKEQTLLPRTYMNEEGNYPQHLGKPKLSYSQKSSYTENKYHQDYREHYFMGGPRTSNPYSEFGGQCGVFIETNGEQRGEMLSDKDVEILSKIERFDNSRYEVEVVIDRGWYVVQGFIDIETIFPDGLVLKDYKTGSISSKADFYESEEYQQTTLYCHQRELEGQKIKYSGVTLLDRGGNAFQGEDLFLTGEILEVETPYGTERAEAFLKELDKIAEDISFAYKIHQEVCKIKV